MNHGTVNGETEGKRGKDGGWEEGDEGWGMGKGERKTNRKGVLHSPLSGFRP
jgi:hypothetical protein